VKKCFRFILSLDVAGLLCGCMYDRVRNDKDRIESMGGHESDNGRQGPASPRAGPGPWAHAAQWDRKISVWQSLLFRGWC
jgi:hypothetical protein